MAAASSGSGARRARQRASGALRRRGAHRRRRRRGKHPPAQPLFLQVSILNLSPRRVEILAPPLMVGTGDGERLSLAQVQAQEGVKKEVATGPATVNDLPDDVLKLVLLRLGPLALVRAVATCKWWCRLVADVEFLCQFRSLHASHFVGCCHIADPTFTGAQRGGNNVFVPELSPVDALDRHHLSLDFLPEADGDGSRLELAETRAGLVLLYQKTWSGDVYFPNMLVCEPLSRRYQSILRQQKMEYSRCLGVFLIEGADETGRYISMSNFRVLSAIYEPAMPYWKGDYTPPRPQAYVFSSSGDDGWHTVGSDSGSDIELPSFELISFIGRAGQSLYWELGCDDTVLALDETTAEFSLITIPAIVGESYNPSTFRVIGGGDDMMRVVHLIRNDFKIFTQLKGSGGEWVVEKLVRLPVATHGLPAHNMGLFHNYVRILTASGRYLVTPRVTIWLFSIEVEMSVVEREREHERNKFFFISGNGRLQRFVVYSALEGTGQIV